MKKLLTVVLFICFKNIQAQNVGIGTTTPSHSLTIQTGHNYGLVHKGTNTWLGTYTDNGYGWLGTVTQHPLYLGTGENIHAAFTTNGHFGLGVSAPKAPFTVGAGKTVLFGEDTLGAGDKMMWIPAKGAFRAGRITNTFWNTDSTGMYSFAAGENTRAKNYASTAFGFETLASGLASFAWGIRDTASGYAATVFGQDCIASGNYAIAGGYKATASKIFAIALGSEARASGLDAIAIGPLASATGSSSIALGLRINASGPASTGLGSDNTSSGQRSTAIGAGNTSSGHFSTAIGAGNTASGQHSTAIGAGNTSSGELSISLGGNNTAAGQYSTVAGSGAAALGRASTAIGYQTLATGIKATALGYQTLALGDTSTAMGYATTASGNTSTALGYKTTARAFASFAAGQYNDSITTSNIQTWVATDPVLIIGNGTTDASRHNAAVIYKNGNADLNGFVRIGEITEGAPRIKTKKITGYNTPGAANPNTFTLVPHGISNPNKILSISVLVTDGSYQLMPHSTETGLLYTVNTDPNGGGTGSIAVGVKSAIQSSSVMGKPIKIFITYEE
jgi:hypothetical protein